MTYYTAITLDPCVGLVHPEVRINEVASALSSMAIYGVIGRLTVGLNFAMYGGMYAVSGAAPVAVPNQSFKLTPSATNYIYADSGGVAHLVTTAPTGWPGPMAGLRALYQLVVGTDSITSGTCWNIGPGQVGPLGPAGPIGPSGSELWLQRKRIRQVQGFASGSSFTAGNCPGFEDSATVGGGGGGIVQGSDSTTFIGCLPRETCSPGTSAANSSGGRRSTVNLITLGNAAGRGGFDFTFRFGVITTATHARQFFGFYDVSGGDPSATANPSAILNMVGVGCDDGDTHLQFMVNGGSGTATKIDLGSNFPSTSSTGYVVEARFWCSANATAINYSVSAPESGNIVTGTVTTNLPQNTAFMGWIYYSNTGAGGLNVFISFMQVAGYTRY